MKRDVNRNIIENNQFLSKVFEGHVENYVKLIEINGVL